MAGFHLHTRGLRRAILATAAILAATGAQAAQPFKVFDIPGAGTSLGQGTFALGINSKNVITGEYVTSDGTAHGFFGIATGTMTTFDAPGAGTGPAEGTIASAINKSGVITGHLTDTKAHGFVRLSDGTFQTFDVVPGTDTAPTAINDKGTVTGQADSNGFVRTANGRIKQFSAPGAANTIPLAINHSGAIAGYFYDSSNFQHGFVRAVGGAITTFDMPGGFDNTYVASINDAGDIAGYARNNAATIGFVRKADGEVQTILSVPGCSPNYIYAYSINNAGSVIGQCYDGNFIMHGFIRFLDGVTESFQAPNSAAGTFPNTLSANGRSVGYAVDVNDVYHGFRLNPLVEPPQ